MIFTGAKESFNSPSLGRLNFVSGGREIFESSPVDFRLKEAEFKEPVIYPDMMWQSIVNRDPKKWDTC